MIKSLPALVAEFRESDGDPWDTIDEIETRASHLERTARAVLFCLDSPLAGDVRPLMQPAIAGLREALDGDAEAPERAPIRVYLNLNCAEPFADHAIVLDIDRADLERVRHVAEANGLCAASVAVDYELKAYAEFDGEPAAGVMGEAFAERLADGEEGDDSGLELRLQGEQLTITPAGWVVFEASDKYSGVAYESEIFDFTELDRAADATEQEGAANG